MLENLKIAARKHAKLIFIFLLTIFLPAVSLSIFGIRAIRNESYRQAKQLENEHRRAADDLKSGINSRIQELASSLQDLAQQAAFARKDCPAIRELLKGQLADNRLIEQVFLAYENKETLFPLLLPGPCQQPVPDASPPKGLQGEILKRAQRLEFKDHQYGEAISSYRELFNLSRDKNTRAQMLSHIARCQMKAGDYREAVRNYLRIGTDYPDSRTPSNLPLALVSRLQLANGYQDLRDGRKAMATSLDLYRDIVQMRWDLTEAQFRSYSSLAEETASRVMAENGGSFSTDTYRQELERLKTQRRERIKQWQVVQDIRQEVIPELQRLPLPPEGAEDSPVRYSQAIGDIPYLILAAVIPGGTGATRAGWLGVKVEDDYLKKEVVAKLIGNLPSPETRKIVISDLAGRVVFGETRPAAGISTAAAYFEDNFPPWKIELFAAKTAGSGIVDLRRNFYFWTIITLIIILVFGAALTARTIVQEVEVLKIKSDFVSAVSHEFKTPLTSIRALTERLREGKVKDAAKMQEYFSVISQDADRLTTLVRNLLDFSKIEEGKKEYGFVETDMARLVAQEVENFRKDRGQSEIILRLQIADELPRLQVDPDALAQALNNLLDNAVKFSPGRPEVDVAAKKEGGDVTLQVQDRGIGIPQDELTRIFDKFYQGKSAAKSSVKGTGLGLTLVKHTMDAHGGRISVKSQVGGGSTFSLIFPVQRKAR